MKTGTDISISQCRSNSYPVVEHGKKPMDPETDYLLTISNYHNWTDNGKPKIGFTKDELYLYCGMISYADLWETFTRHGDGIKEFCDFKNCPHPAPDENPSFYDFVSLAGTVSGYCGIE